MAEKQTPTPKVAPAPAPKSAPEAKNRVTDNTRRQLNVLKNAAPASIKKQRDINEVKKYVQTETKQLSTQVESVKKYQKSTQFSVNFWTKKEREATTPAEKAAAKRNLEKARMNKAEYDALSRNLQKRSEASRVRMGNAEDALKKGRGDVALDRARSAADFATVDTNMVAEARMRARQKAVLHNTGQLTEADVAHLSERELASLHANRRQELGVEGGTKLADPSPILDAASHEFRRGTTPTFNVQGEQFSVKPTGEIAGADGRVLKPGTTEYKAVVDGYTNQAERAEKQSQELLRTWSARQKDLKINARDAKELTRLIKDMASPFLTAQERNDLLYAFKTKGAKAVINAAKVRAPELRAEAQKDFEESWYVMDKLLKDVRNVALAYGISLGIGALGAGSVAAAPAAVPAALTGRASVPLLNAAAKPALNAADDLAMGLAPKLFSRVTPKLSPAGSKISAEAASGIPKAMQNELRAAQQKLADLVAKGKGDSALAQKIRSTIEKRMQDLAS